MKVQVVGGPHDGAQMTVRDETPSGSLLKWQKDPEARYRLTPRGTHKVAAYVPRAVRP